MLHFFFFLVWGSYLKSLFVFSVREILICTACLSWVAAKFPSGWTFNYRWQPVWTCSHRGIWACLSFSCSRRRLSLVVRCPSHCAWVSGLLDRTGLSWASTSSRPLHMAFGLALNSHFCFQAFDDVELRFANFWVCLLSGTISHACGQKNI